MTRALLLGACLAVGAAACRPADSPPAPALSAEEAPGPVDDRPEAPDFTLRTPDGEPFTLSEHRGRVVLINFWATWCPPCVVEVPELVRLQEELRDEGLVVVGVSQDAGPAAFDDVRDFGRMFAVNYPLVLDPGQQVGQRYDGARTLPTTVVVDRDGRIHARQHGLLDRRALLALLDGLLPLPPP